MNNDINLKEIEKKVFMSYHKDGLIDICLGFILLCFGLFILADMPYLAAIGIAIVFPVYAQLKKVITIPRLGMVKFSKDREVKESKKKNIFQLIVLGLTIAFIAFLICMWFVWRNGLSGPFFDLLKENFRIIMGIILSLIIISGALVFEMRRFYAYAGIVLLSFMTSVILSYPEPEIWCFIIPGILIMFSGAVLLTMFMSGNPVIQKTVGGGV